MASKSGSALKGETSCSVVIPSIGRFTHLTDCISDLDRQSTPPDEILIIIQGKIHECAARDLITSSQQKVRVFFLDVPNASLARNIGLKFASGSVVLFLDDDIRIHDPEFLAKHLRNFDDPAVSGVYGQVLEMDQDTVSKPEPDRIETDWGWMLLPPNYGRRCQTRNGGSGNLAVRGEWARTIGGMDARFERGARREETEFNLRYTKAYGPLVFDPEASLLHLSAAGGSRSWGRVIRTVPWHHIIGHWYFLLAACRDRTLGFKGLILEVRHIAVALLRNPATGWNVLAFAKNCARALLGLTIATGQIVRGPLRLDRLDHRLFRELYFSKSHEQPAIP